MTRGSVAIGLGCGALLMQAGCAVATELGASGDAYVAEVDAWHAEREARLRSDTGWLTLAGLHELRPGVQTFGSGTGADIVTTEAAPAEVGRFVVGDDRVFFEPAGGVDLSVFDGPGEVGERIELATDGAGEPTVLSTGRVLFHVIDRGGGRYVRVRDRESASLKAFDGIERYPVDPAYRVTATLRREVGATVLVPSILGYTDEERSPGVLAFELGGVSHTLRPTENADGSLFIVFGDRTNGSGTYPAGRFLSADAVGADGTVVLDFNRAYNPVCAMSPYATCPMPPEGNVLAAAVEAGEKY